MNKFIAIVIAGVTAFSAPVLIATPGAAHSYDASHHHYGHVRNHRDWDRRHSDHRRWESNRWDRRYTPRGYYGTRPYYHSYGDYRVGQVYRYHGNRRYEVNDYHRYGLPAPRPGYRYYRDDRGNVIMAAIAGGVIGLIIGGALD